MISSVNSLFSNSISLLFGTRSTSGATQTGSAGERELNQATGHPDIALKAGNAIGKLIAIAAGMKQSDTMFTRERAGRVDALDGEYSPEIVAGMQQSGTFTM